MRYTATALATLVTLGLGSALMAAPAHAADAEPLIVKSQPNDGWRARASYIDDSNQFCTRAYNSGPNEKSVVSITWGQGHRNLTDWGGDDDATCYDMDNSPEPWNENASFTWVLTYHGSITGSSKAIGGGQF